MMNNVYTAVLSWLVLFLFPCLSHASAPSDSTGFNLIVEDMQKEFSSLSSWYFSKTAPLEKRMGVLKRKLKRRAGNKGSPEYFLAYLEKLQIREELGLLEQQFQLELAKARYRKGLELIKIMYEKILDLDHHFYSLQTYQNVIQLSNPNTYPEFQETKSIIENRLKKKNAFALPNLLQSNPYLSATFSLVASFIGSGEAHRKEEELEKIACILDFTVRMNSDLSIIYYETEFLKEGNATLRENCIQLFREYTKIIGYKVVLNECRKEDDWESIYERLGDFIQKLQDAATKSNDDPLSRRSLMKGFANLEFSIDRLLDFLNKYSNFITQGEKYYQKFHIIVSNYKNEAHCAGKLPPQFSTLKQDINYSIRKFNEAYNIAELTGSKLKDLLYGVSE